ncbi:MAG TPA: HAD-IA family hydrolase [Thermomicrobiales bacterium]|nr:HAD-IA family hydrolase [Thermomicrobiales bacterium]
MTEAIRPIRLVTFDLYDTLIELRPPRWERLAAACRSIGLEADPLVLRAADRVSEDFYTVENGRLPIRDRPVAAQQAFRVELMRRWLAAAGLPHDRETAQTLRDAYLSEFDETPNYRHYRLFDDVMPALRRLRSGGVKTAVVSNADADVTVICVHFAFADLMDLIVTSALVGYEKPDSRTFHAALDPLGIAPAHALHIGDQPKSDVAGALDIGMRAILLDRYGRHPDSPVPTVPSLTALADLVLDVPAAVGERR